MNSSDDYYLINKLNNATIYIHKYIVVVLYIVSNIGNILSALVFLKKSWKKNVCVFYFKVCLLSNSCYINFIVFATIFTDGFLINLQDSNIVLCKLYLYAYFLFISLSPTFLILASIDRLLISSQNVDTRLYSSKRLAYFSISVSTVFWIVFSTHALIKCGINETYPSSFVCDYNSSEFYANFVICFYGAICFLFCLLMIILCMFAFKNVRRIRAVPRDKRHEIRSMTKKDFQLLRCLFAQDIVFIIFGTTLAIFYIYQALKKNQIRTILERTIVNFLQNLVNFLFDIPYCSNFFVFLIVSKAFRHELKRIMYKIIGKNLAPIREEENRQENVGRDNVELNVVSTIVLPA